MRCCRKCQGPLRYDREFPGMVCQSCGVVYYIGPPPDTMSGELGGVAVGIRLMPHSRIRLYFPKISADVPVVGRSCLTNRQDTLRHIVLRRIHQLGNDVGV